MSMCLLPSCIIGFLVNAIADLLSQICTKFSRVLYTPGCSRWAFSLTLFTGRISVDSGGLRWRFELKIGGKVPWTLLYQPFERFLPSPSPENGIPDRILRVLGPPCVEIWNERGLGSRFGSPPIVNPELLLIPSSGYCCVCAGDWFWSEVG